MCVCVTSEVSCCSLSDYCPWNVYVAAWDVSRTNFWQCSTRGQHLSSFQPWTSYTLLHMHWKVIYLVNLSSVAKVINLYWPGKRLNALNCTFSYCNILFWLASKTESWTHIIKIGGGFQTVSFQIMFLDMLMICLLPVCRLTLCRFPIWISDFSFPSHLQLVWSLWGACRGCQWITTSWSAPKDWRTYTLSCTWTAHTTTWQAWRVWKTVLCSAHWTCGPIAWLR